MASIYVETTVPSYLMARPSRDLVRAAHPQITREWWYGSAPRFELFVSEAVVEEISVRDPVAALERQNAIKDLPILHLDHRVLALAREYEGSLGLPSKAHVDIIHIACATAYELDFLVTWNCRHIANGAVIRRLIECNMAAGRSTPLIVTPEALLE
jgi:hypothetical protein